MALPDSDISDWSTTTASNPPTDGTIIGRDLADQFRNTKSIVRDESLNKQWEKVGSTATTTSAGSVFTAVFPEAAGNMVTTFTDSRKVRLVPITGTGTVYAGVVLASYTSNTTSVSLACLDGTPQSSEEYAIAVGTENPSGSHLPAYGQAGTLTISAAATNGTVTFDRAEADKAYFAKTTVISTNSAVAYSNTICQVDKGTVNMVIHLLAAPGGSEEVVIGWTLLRES